MSDSDAVMVEDSSRPTVLIVEDNKDYGANALAALRGNKVALATTLEDATTVLKGMKVDYILSDVHFPSEAGAEAKENITGLIVLAMDLNVPICFVTKADHHGLLDCGDEGYVAIAAVTPEKMLTTLMKPCESEDESLFRKLDASEKKTVKAESKSPEIWKQAFDMLKNAAAKPKSCIGMAMDKVRDVTGLSVTAKNGMPVLTAPKIRR